MTETQVALVQDSFKTLEPIADVAADMFYARLFELDPSLRPLFRTDRKEQGRKLMQMIGVAVKGLSHLEQILPAVEQLGRRHVQYGVRTEHYEIVGQALLWTLANGVGSAFTPEVRGAWAAAYDLLAAAMQRAANSVETAMLTAYA